MNKEFAQPATDGVRYPALVFNANRCDHNTVSLDDNAYLLVNGVERVLKRGGVPLAERKMFREQAFSGGYIKMLDTVFRWVTVRCSNGIHQPAAEGVRYPALVFDQTNFRGWKIKAVIFAVHEILWKRGVSLTERKRFFDEALSGDYINCLSTVSRWVTVR